MPVPTQIAHASTSFKRNQSLLKKSFIGLTPEEWRKRPSECANDLLWITGHIIWARSAALKFLGAPAWSLPWLAQFARGVRKNSEEQLPSPEEILSAFSDITTALIQSMENASPESLDAPAPPNSPPGDGTVAGIVNFLAFHETYHVGQVAYLRCWLGHDGPQG